MPVKTKIKQATPHTELVEQLAQERGYSMRRIHLREFRKLTSRDLRFKHENEILVVVEGKLEAPDCFCAVVLPVKFYSDIERAFAYAASVAKGFSALPSVLGFKIDG